MYLFLLIKVLRTKLLNLTCLRLGTSRLKFPDPIISSMARLEQVLRSIKGQYAKRNLGSRQCLHITPELLRAIRTVWGKKAHSQDSIMLWAAVCLCFFGFLRAGEMTVPSDHAYDPGVHLNFNDIAIDSKINPSIMRVTIKASKTDPFRQGIEIFVGRTHTDLCPIEATLAYLAARGGTQGPLFAFADGRFLTRDRLVHHVQDALSTAGVDCIAYAGHSFRIGAVTTAARRGIQDATIKMLGRWESSAYLLYIKTPRDQLSAVSSIL